jgi:hypothetical protein
MRRVINKSVCEYFSHCRQAVATTKRKDFHVRSVPRRPERERHQCQMLALDCTMAFYKIFGLYNRPFNFALKMFLSGRVNGVEEENQERVKERSNKANY